MIYIFGGPGKTGCTKLATDFAEQFGLERVYGGGFMRLEAMKAGFYKKGYVLPEDQKKWDLDQAMVPDFRKVCEQNNREIDHEIDEYSLTRMITASLDQEQLVVESKVMARFLTLPSIRPMFEKVTQELNVTGKISFENLFYNTQSFWIHADPEVRARRSLEKSIPLINSEGTPRIITQEMIDLEKTEILTRQTVDAADYVRIYGMTDYPLGGQYPSGDYGNVIQNNGSKEQGYAQIMKCINYKEGAVPLKY